MRWSPSFTVQMRLEGAHQDEEQIVLSFRAKYWVVYTFESEELDNTALGHFADYNAPFNVYPYFRELVDTNSKKMGLDGITLPLYKPNEIGSMRKTWTKGKGTEQVAAESDN